MTDRGDGEEPRVERPPLNLRPKRRVLFPDMVDLRWRRRRPAAELSSAEVVQAPPQPAGAAAAQPDDGPAQRPPLYWRLLRLRYVRPNGWLRALFIEGSVALAVVLVLAGAVSVWTIIALPVLIAVLVKLNDMIAGALRANAK